MTTTDEKPQKIKTGDCLPKSPARSEWMRLWDESEGGLDEKLTAVYIRALQPDCFSHYGPIPEPLAPNGYFEDYKRYKELQDKCNGWRSLSEKYRGYFKAVEDAKYETESNRSFLEQMKDHFDKVGLLSHAERCRQKLIEFGNQ